MMTPRLIGYLVGASAIALVLVGGGLVVQDIRQDMRKLTASVSQTGGSGADSGADTTRLAAERDKLHAADLARLADERRKFDEGERAKLAEARQSEDRVERAKLAEARQAEDRSERARLAESRQASQQVAQAPEPRPAAPPPAPAAPAPVARPAPAPEKPAEQVAALTPPAAGDAAFLVVSSTADGLKKGDAVQGGQALTLKAGTRLVLLDGAGKVLTLRGPYSGTPGGDSKDGSGALGKLFSAVRDQGSQPNRGVGAFRSIGLGQGDGAANTVAVSVNESATYCLTKGQSPVLAGGVPETGKVTVKAIQGGQSASVTFPRVGTPAWPASVPVKDGASYQLTGNDGVAQTVKLVVADEAPQSGQRALWMAERGCMRQAVEAAERLEREGGAQGLFDLELRTTNKPSPSYKIGESLELSVRSTREAFLYCFYVDIGGEMTKIFPSQFETGAKVDSVVPQAIPGPKWSSPMLLTGPAGTSEVRCFATDRDATAHLPPEIGKPGFTKLSAAATANLMDTFMRLPDANVATAGIAISVQ
jgi:biotin carboxyl carrier protein